MTQLKCPLFLEQWREAQGFIQVCLKEGCAWWDANEEQCCIKTLAQSGMSKVFDK